MSIQELKNYCERTGKVILAKKGILKGFRGKNGE